MTGKRKFIKILDFSDKSKRTRLLLQFLSLAFAVSLWLFVTWDSSAPSVKTMSVPLKYLGLQDGYSISNETSVVEVTLEGKIEGLALMNRSEVVASVMVRDLRTGKYRLPVQLEIPEGIRLASYSPQVVDIELFRIIERTMRPTLSVIGTTPENLSLGTVEITPREVVARGPETIIMSLRRAEVRSTVDKLVKGINEDLPVALVGNEGDIEGVLVEPANVRVNAKLAEAVDQKRVPVRVFVEGVPAEGFDVGSVSVSPDMVTLRGRKSSLSNVNEIILDAIDVTGHSEVMDVDLPLDPPMSDIVILSADRVNVKVGFNSAVEIVTFQGVPVRVEGHGVYDEWVVGPSMVNVTVERTIGVAEPFDMGNPGFELYVDVTNIVSRRMMLPILNKNIPEGVRILRVDPEQVTINAVIR
jgi:YbbR domain-containing protein